MNPFQQPGVVTFMPDGTPYLAEDTNFAPGDPDGTVTQERDLFAQAVEIEERRILAKRQAHANIQAKQDEFLRSPEGRAEAAARFEASIVDLDDLEDPQPIIEGFLYRDTLVRTFGPPKSLKSFVTLDMAACVSLGVPWQGQQTHQGIVLYVVAEGARGVKKRRDAWNEHHQNDMKVIFYQKPVQIGEQDQMYDLISYTLFKQVDYVIFDTQARCTVGVEENDNTEMGRIVAALDVLKQETGACVHLVHHSTGADENKARGATAFDGAVDTEFVVKRNKTNKEQVELHTKFQKDEEESEPVEMQTRKVGASLVLEAAAGAAHAADSGDPSNLPPVTEGQMPYLRIVADYPATGIAQKDLAKEIGRDTSTVSRVINKLVPMGVMELNGSRLMVTDLGWKVIRWRSRHEPAQGSQGVQWVPETMIE